METRNSHSKRSSESVLVPCLRTIIESCEQRQQQQEQRHSRKKDTIDKLCSIVDTLKELDEFIGIREVKQTIVEHVLYLAQNLSSDDDMNHIQIVGDPGMGKTTLAILLGRVYAGLGFLKEGKVICVTRADLIGEHLGSTSIKTEEMLNTCRGNVMFIDEVYSFGCRDRRDSFSKECLDCINQYLSVYRNDLLCIIAGYEDDIKECVFSVNRGLERRFPFKYKIERYTMNELREIFLSQVRLNEWSIDTKTNTERVLDSVFNEQNEKYFGSFGGDTEILFVRCKMAHSSRLFVENKTRLKKKVLNDHDIKRGFNMFLSLKKSTMKSNEHVSMMYL